MVPVSTRLQEIDRELDVDHNVNAWSDFLLSIVQEKIAVLSQSEWDELITLIPHRSSAWVIRLLEAAAYAGDRVSRIIPLALSLLCASDIRVAQSAAETLEGNDDIFTPNEVHRPLLEAVAARVSPNERLVIDDLIRRISRI